MTAFLRKYHVSIAFLVLCMIGGTTWAFQKLGLEGSLPLWSSGMRFFIAGLLIAGFQVAQKKFKVDSTLLKLASLNGLFYFAVPFGSVYWASNQLPSGLISVLATFITIFALILNKLLRGVPTTKTQQVGVSAALVGILVVFGDRIAFNQDISDAFAMAVVLTAMLGSAAITVTVQRKIRDLPLLTFVSVSMLSGAFFLLSLSLFVETGVRSFSGISLYALMYLAIIGSTVGFSLNVLILKNWHISKATSHLFISPVIALYIGYVFLGEKLTANIYVGTALVITGVMFINIKQRSVESCAARESTSQ
ncbi:EamA family transporter [Marinobacter halodurans]|uniref:EamA family transporter n=2 Tax=Marinobacter halodurans TaxID=2528979 RepID=A0ABY1ZHA9_9GAMM|nr:EamA family transporter [Marinobacter halodurans]